MTHGISSLANNSTISGGQANIIRTPGISSSALSSTIGGGNGNLIESTGDFSEAQYGTIGGGVINIINPSGDAARSVVSTINGGLRNTIVSSGNSSRTSAGTISGGVVNIIISGNTGADNPVSTIGGGLFNVILSDGVSSKTGAGTIGGGVFNFIVAADDNANTRACTIGGGVFNEIFHFSGATGAADFSTIGGGFENAIEEASYATIPGGQGLLLNFDDTCAVGRFNQPGPIGAGFAFVPPGSSGAFSGVTGVAGGQRIFMVGYGTSSTSRSNLMSVTQDGVVHALTGFSAGGADYAEWFESNDGNTILPGTSVVFVQNSSKIRPANLNEIPFGVVSSNPSIIANSAEEQWHGMFERDAYGRLIVEPFRENRELHSKGTNASSQIEQEIIDQLQFQQIDPNLVIGLEDIGTVIQNLTGLNLMGSTGSTGAQSDFRSAHENKISYRLKLSQNYDPSKLYTPRSARSEWNPVGLVGKIKILKGQPVASNWIKLESAGGLFDCWLIK